MDLLNDEATRLAFQSASLQDRASCDNEQKFSSTASSLQTNQGHWYPLHATQHLYNVPRHPRASLQGNAGFENRQSWSNDERFLQIRPAQRSLSDPLSNNYVPRYAQGETCEKLSNVQEDRSADLDQDAEKLALQLACLQLTMGEDVNQQPRYQTNTIQIPTNRGIRQVQLGTKPPVSRDRNSKRKNDHCVFCKNNGEEAWMYRSHRFTDQNDIVQCPVLRNYNCPICHNGGGDHAHTLKYCPQRKFNRDFHFRTNSN